jgi:hypothetical protein
MRNRKGISGYPIIFIKYSEVKPSGSETPIQLEEIPDFISKAISHAKDVFKFEITFPDPEKEDNRGG